MYKEGVERCLQQEGRWNYKVVQREGRRLQTTDMSGVGGLQR